MGYVMILAEYTSKIATGKEDAAGAIVTLNTWFWKESTLVIAFPMRRKLGIGDHTWLFYSPSPK
jgi:hypothetical protein